MRAARLFGAANAGLVASTGSRFRSVSPAERAAHDAALLSVQKELGEAEFRRICKAGSELAFADAVAEGLNCHHGRPPIPSRDGSGRWSYSSLRGTPIWKFARRW